ncbi:hypothetical protein FOZ60_001861 [Perkinsus olseni]|uniref:Uncharacterized protein n=1 Tax=Perkinsus olseni TaxID=32597 RepID=A0A7J6PJR3_PEROL|nr:hypothetical protein FOZ60_001861 [Perkinsus olseni]
MAAYVTTNRLTMDDRFVIEGVAVRRGLSMRPETAPAGVAYRHLDHRLDRWHKPWKPIMPRSPPDYRHIYWKRSKQLLKILAPFRPSTSTAATAVRGFSIRGTASHSTGRAGHAMTLIPPRVGYDRRRPCSCPPMCRGY